MSEIAESYCEQITLGSTICTAVMWRTALCSLTMKNETWRSVWLEVYFLLKALHLFQFKITVSVWKCRQFFFPFNCFGFLSFLESIIFIGTIKNSGFSSGGIVECLTYVPFVKGSTEIMLWYKAHTHKTTNNYIIHVFITNAKPKWGSLILCTCVKKKSSYNIIYLLKMWIFYQWFLLCFVRVIHHQSAYCFEKNNKWFFVTDGIYIIYIFTPEEEEIYFVNV